MNANQTSQRRKRAGAAVLLLALLLVLVWTPDGSNAPMKRSVAPVVTVPPATPVRSDSVEIKAVDAFTAFENWMTKAEAKRDAWGTPELEEGERLATARRTAMLELMVSDPKNALAMAVSEKRAANLPEPIRAKLETRVSGRADLSAVVTLPTDTRATPEVKRYANVNNRTYRAYMYGRRANKGQVNGATIHGIAIGDALAVHEDPVRPISLNDVADLNAVIDAAAEAECPVSLEAALSKGDLALAEVGGRMVYLCSQGHIFALNEEIVAQEGAGTGSGIAQSAMSEGTKTLLFIRVDFSDMTGEPVSTAAAQTLIDTTCSNYFQENSYGVTTLTGTVTTLLRMPQTADFYKTAANGDITLLSDARAAATAAGYTNSNFNLDIVAFKSLFPGWAGQGYVGGKGTWLNGYFDLRVTCHELGHNFGLWHANYWQTTDGTAIGAGSNNEYGDVFDVMGGGGTAAYHFNAYEKNVLNWMPTSYVNSVGASGTYRVFTHDQSALNAANKYALKVNKDGSRYYWLELRQALTGNAHLMNSIGVRWGQWASSNGGSQLLDTTPGSSGGKNDAGLYVGRTFSDTAANLHITPIGKAGTTPEAMDVVVNIGAFASNQAPAVSLASSAQYVGTGTEVTLTATGTDADNDTLAYFWTFSDGALGSNNAEQKRTWNTLGTKTITVLVSDMKGKTATASMNVEVTATPPNQTLTTTLVSSGSEAGAAGVVKVSRTGTTTGALTFTYQISGTATAGSDYTTLTGTGNFSANVTDAEIQIAPIEDSVFEGDETVIVKVIAGASYNVNGSGQATVTIVDNETGAITSGITPTPAAPVTKQNVQFSCASNIPSATYAWDFGDGTSAAASANGASTSHAYTTAGTYTVTVTATHPVTGGTAVASLQLVVKPAPLVLPVTKLSGSVRYDKNDGDAISMGFSVPDIKPGWLPLGQSVTVTVGGVSKSFTLGKTGSGKDGTSSASLKVGKTSATTLTISMKGSMAGDWARAGADFNVTAKNSTRKLPIIVQVGGKKYEMLQTVVFTSTKDKKGTFRK